MLSLCKCPKLIMTTSSTTPLIIGKIFHTIPIAVNLYNDKENNPLEQVSINLIIMAIMKHTDMY